MNERDFLFHNVAEVCPSPSGLRLFRFPRTLCDTMGESGRVYGRYVSQTTAGCEIRFVSEGDRALIALSSMDEDGFVQVYRGDYRYYSGYIYSFPVRKGRVTPLMLTKSPAFEALDSRYHRKPGGFSGDVWRILSDINFTMTLVDAEDYGYGLRPPRPDEMPSRTLLAYGTSLTYGACASSHSVSYVQLLGRLLNCNVLNKAMGGSCMNEAAVADYFASDALRYDAVLLENAVNMGGMDEAYRRNAGYLVERIARSRPHTPIYCVTCYPNGSIVAGESACPCEKRVHEDCANHRGDVIMGEIAAGYENCHVIEGGEVMNDFTNLTCDLVHLSDYGHIMTAQNLARLMDF